MSNYTWEKNITPKWEPVSFSAACIYEDTLFFSGGWNPLTNIFSSQFWRCNRDFQWKSLPTINTWDPRNGHSLTKFHNKLVLTGGFNYSKKFLGDVWVLNPANSIEEWECILPIAPWSGREGHKTIVFRDSLWIYGGVSSSGTNNDIWVSKDGINWEEVASSSSWSRRCFHNVQIYNDKLWLIAGSSTTEIANNDMYVSSNGIDWDLFDGNLPISPRLGSGVTVFDNKLWLIGGSNANEQHFYNDVWWFTEKEGWNQLLIDTPWKPRWGFNCVNVFNDKLVILCGGVRFPDRKYSAYTDGWVLR